MLDLVLNNRGCIWVPPCRRWCLKQALLLACLIMTCYYRHYDYLLLYILNHSYLIISVCVWTCLQQLLLSPSTASGEFAAPNPRLLSVIGGCIPFLLSFHCLSLSFWEHVHVCILSLPRRGGRRVVHVHLYLTDVHVHAVLTCDMYLYF